MLLDNCANASRGALEALETLAGRKVTFIEGDVRDARTLDGVFAAHRVGAVPHLAGLKDTGAPAQEPDSLHDNNVLATRVLAARMAASGVKTLIFSSSAAVYAQNPNPVAENARLEPQSPYGRSKLLAETILTDLQGKDPSWRISILRYFNVAGAHPHGELGDGLWGKAGNLLPRIGEAVLGLRDALSVYGNDYSTGESVPDPKRCAGDGLRRIGTGWSGRVTSPREGTTQTDRQSRWLSA